MSKDPLALLLFLFGTFMQTVYSAALPSEMVGSYTIADREYCEDSIFMPLSSPTNGEKYIAFIEEYEDKSFRLKVYRFPSRPSDYLHQYQIPETQEYNDFMTLISEMLDYISFRRLQETEVLLKKDKDLFNYFIAEVRNIPKAFINRKVHQTLSASLHLNSRHNSPILPIPLVDNDMLYGKNTFIALPFSDQYLKQFMAKKWDKRFKPCCRCGNDFPAIKLINGNQCRLCQADDMQQAGIESDAVRRDIQREPPQEQRKHIPLLAGYTHKEVYRELSFKDYPFGAHNVSDIEKLKKIMTSAGFFWTGYRTLIKCYSCGVHLEETNLDDNLKTLSYHKSNCALVTNNPYCDTEPNVPKEPHFQYTSVQHLPRPEQVQSNTQHVSNIHRQPNQITQPAPSANVSRFQGMNDEQRRLVTFCQTGNMVLKGKSSQLARIGFYLVENDKTRCFACGLSLGGWSYEDDVLERHKRNKSDCSMLSGGHFQNIGIPHHSAAQASHIPTAAQVLQTTNINDNTFSEDRPQIGQTQSPSERSPERQRSLEDQFPCRSPTNSFMTTYEDRLESFATGHPFGTDHIPATPEQLAEAGLFWLGWGNDRVKCWYCNGGLQNWTPADEPWEEHAKWFPDCEFLNRQKGPDWVREIADQYPNLNLPLMQSGVCAQHGRQVPLRSFTIVNFDDPSAKEEVRKAYREFKNQLVDKGYTEDNILRALEIKPFYRWDVVLLARAIDALGEKKNYCVVCWEKPPTIAFTPCGHVCLCRKCAVKYFADPKSTCPLCRAEVASGYQISSTD